MEYVPHSQRWYRSRAIWLLSLNIALIVSLAAATPPLTALESLTRDWRLRVRGSQPVQARVVLITIDEATFQAIPKPLMFWGAEHAQVFQSLHALGARAIGFDLVQNADLGVALAGYTDQNPDQAEAVALAAIPEMVLSFTYNPLPNGKEQEVLPYGVLTTALQIGGGRLALTNTAPDPDKVVRSMPITDDDGKPAFALALAEIATGQPARRQDHSLTLGQHRFALDEHGFLPLNYAGPGGTVPHIAYHEFLAHPETFRKTIQGTVCLIGTTTLDLQDYHAVPFLHGVGQAQNQMPGVEVQANAVHTLLTGKGIHRVGWPVTCLLIVGAVLLSMPLCWLPRVYWVFPSMFLLIAAWTGASVLAFNQTGLQLPMVGVIVAIICNQFVLVVARLRQEMMHEKWVEGIFGRYVSPGVLQHLLTTPGAIDLGGKREVITVLFSDIRGFTQSSEKMEPEQVTSFLNLYLEKMVDIVFANGGTVDKYIGDAVMAVFNWPVEQPDHAARAVRTALQMQVQVEAAAQEWNAAGFPLLRIGIGVHTGPAVLGNIGSPRRMERTAIGDTVNVASRLEGLTKEIGKQFGTGILISESTVTAMGDALQGEIKLCEAGETVIRGREQKMKLYAGIPTPVAGEAVSSNANDLSHDSAHQSCVPPTLPDKMLQD